MLARGLRFRVYGLGYGVYSARSMRCLHGFKVQGLRFRVWGLQRAKHAMLARGGAIDVVLLLAHVVGGGDACNHAMTHAMTHARTHAMTHAMIATGGLGFRCLSSGFRFQSLEFR